MRIPHAVDAAAADCHARHVGQSFTPCAATVVTSTTSTEPDGLPPVTASPFMLPSADAADSERPHRVLVVEASRAMAGMVAASLDTIDGVVCDQATSLAAARRCVADSGARYFVAVCCLNLPDAPDGQIVDELQRAGLRVIVLTGHVDDSWRTRMFERGVADYVVKESVAGIEYVRRAVARMYANLDTCVLVVDDAQVFRDYASGLLAQHGYRTLTAADGAAGLEMLAAHPEIRLVVTDYMMPKLDGLAMVREMRKLRSADDLAVIAITESDRAGALARFLKSGANDFLRKPFCVEEFYCRIDQNIDMLRAVLDARRLAERDSLTGLFNRRYFFEHARRLHRRALDGDVCIVTAMIDVDHFKRINDTYGHSVGDRALVEVAARIDELAGSAGIVARVGGEEFALVGMLGDGADPADCLETLRAGIDAIRLELDGDVVRVSASIGATLDLQADLDGMLAIADRAVYRAKERGRNRVVID